MNDVLIIDDEAGIRSTLAAILEDEKYKVHTTEDAVEGIALLENHNIDLIFLDVLLPRLGGLEALERIRSTWTDIEVIVISGHANIDMAVRAVKLGAFDFLEKPLSLDKVLTVSRNALMLRKLRAENINLKKNIGPKPEEIIGSSDAIQQVRGLIDQAASSDARILISGENGTGKELVARAVHYASSRADKPFIEVNCAAIPDTLIESELFGHEKGAFTDAISGRKGRFEAASGGTIFLDEIGDMSLKAQSKVLRAIQEQRIERVGGEKVIEVDVRIVAATNKDLEAECRAGRFREDLFFRLNVIPIRLPPLRSRSEDVPMLLHHFLMQFNAGNAELNSRAMQFLSSYAWPGNIRELKNFAERIAVMCGNEIITVEDVQQLLQNAKTGTGPHIKNTSSELPMGILELNFNDARDSFEKQYLEHKLSENGYIIARAAEAIGMYPSNLHAKIRKYGIRMDR